MRLLQILCGSDATSHVLIEDGARARTHATPQYSDASFGLRLVLDTFP